MMIKLVYFNARGRGELARLIAIYGKIEFEDVRLELKDWPEIKPTMPYTTLPVLEVDGVKVGQSLAIARFLAKKAGIAGKDELEQALADGIVDFVKDLMNDMSKARFPSSPEEKIKVAQEFVNIKAPKFCEIVEKLLDKNGGKYFVGESLTYADIAVAHVIDLIDYPEELGFKGVADVEGRFEVLAKFPLLEKHRAMINNLDGIKEWLEKRPQTPI